MTVYHYSRMIHSFYPVITISPTFTFGTSYHWSVEFKIDNKNIYLIKYSIIDSYENIEAIEIYKRDKSLHVYDRIILYDRSSKDPQPLREF